MPTEHSADHTAIFTRRESNARSYCRAMPALFTRAKGSELFDAEGRRYIDFLAGCASLNYGHNDPDMQAALIAHIQNDGITHALDLHTEAKGAFLDTFERLILKPRGMDHKIMLTGPTGTNAVEAALKLARKATGRTNVIAFSNGFHGMTMGALAATGNKGKRGGSGMAALDGVTHMPFEGSFGPDVDSLSLIEQMLDNPSSGVDAPAAFLIEGVQGEGGLNAASAHFLQGIARLARAHGALLIMDEIQAGCGRTGDFFSFDGMGVEPDLVPMAKSLGGMGLPFAALLIKRKYDIWGPAEHNGTFRGNTHAFVTARVALEKFWSDDSFKAEIARKSALVTEALREMATLVPGATLKGRGMMQGVYMGSGELAGAICARAFEQGLVIETSGARDEVVKVLAPLTTPDTLLREGLAILLQAARDVTAPSAMAAE